MASQPNLRDDLIEYWDAFNVLHAGRSANAPIPLTEIAAYLDIVGVGSADDRLTWMRFLRAMDEAYLNWCRKSAKPRDMIDPAKSKRLT